MFYRSPSAANAEKHPPTSASAILVEGVFSFPLANIFQAGVTEWRPESRRGVLRAKRGYPKRSVAREIRRAVIRQDFTTNNYHNRYQEGTELP